MLKNAMSWSRAHKEFLVSTSARPTVNPIEVTYQRVTVCSIYNNGKTFFGVAIQHPEDVDNKSVGVEVAMINALTSPVFVGLGKLSQSQFYRKANAIYEIYADALRVVQERSVSEDEWLRLDRNAPQFLEDYGYEYPCCDCGCDCECDCECPWDSEMYSDYEDYPRA